MGDNASKVKVLIFGYKEFSQLMNTVLGDYLHVASFKMVDAILVSVNEVVEQVKAFSPDVVVSAGANASYLKSVLDIPVVSLQSVTSDLISAVQKAASVSEDIAVINFRDSSPVIPLLEQNLQVKVSEYTYETPDQARELFLLHSQPGRAIVGASYVCGLAAAKQYPAFLTYSADSCRFALDNAIEKAREYTQVRNGKAVLHWLEKQSKIPIILYHETEQSMSLNQAANQELGITRLTGVDAEVLREAAEQPCPADGEITIAGNSWWYHLDEVGKADQPYFVFQFFPKSQPQSKAPSPVLQKAKLVFKSKAMSALMSQVKSYAASPSNVLIQGESGTGKELIAREIYENGPWKKGNFVALNCSAIPSELFESELFGYREGAFTGSRKGGRKGLVEEASEGVLFLDEISELALDQQAKLLRFLQERTYRPVGGNEEKPVNFKLVAASNKPLRDMVSQEQFREDLFFRLNVFNLFVPPLRMRPDDINCIALPRLQYLFELYDVELAPVALLDEINFLLGNYDWPGNIRELENVLERLVANLAHCQSLSDLIESIETIAPELSMEIASIEEDGLVRSKELELVVDAMQKFGGNKTKVAEYLGMSQTTLWRRLKKLSSQHTNRSDQNGTSQ